VSGAGGHAPRTPIVLLHGATASSRVWQEVAPALEADYRVLAPNLAGHRGGPPLSIEPHRVVPGIVEAVCRELDAAGIPTAHLVGNSLGGWVALELARLGRARSVVAISPAGAWRSARDLTRLLTLFRVGGAVAKTRTGRRLAMNPRTRRRLWRATAEHTERMTLSQVHDTFEDLAGCAILTDLLAGAKRAGPILPFGRVACPTLIAWGSHDRLLPFARYGAPMLTALPGAELHILPGVGHVPMIDHPDLVARTVLEFTERATTRG
jgi:pimeloyl-ACP methyl ester carboxylesterase